MLQKQLGYLIGAAKECCHYFFNWDEFVINQMLLSVMLMLMFSRSAMIDVADSISGMFAGIKEMINNAKEQYNNGSHWDLRLMLKHKNEA